MLPAALLVMAIPLAGAALAYILRRWSSLELLIALLTCAGVIILLASPIDSTISLPGLVIDVDAPLNLLGRVLRVRAPDRVPLLLLFASTTVLFALSWRASQGWPFIPIGLIVLAAMSVALMIRPFVYAALAFEGAAALAAIMIQAERYGERSTQGALRYLATITLALPLFLFAGWVIDRAGNVNLADAEAVAAVYGPSIVLLIAGFGLMIGAIPVFTWVHSVAEDAPPLTTAFLASVGVGAVSFLLLEFWQEYEWLRTNSLAITALTVGGTALLIFGGLLAWAQNSFSRVLACGILVDIGCALLVMSNSEQLSVEALAFSTLARSLSLGVFGLGIWRLREMRGGDNFKAGRGLRDIWTAMALGAGGLSLAGLPSTLGFVSRWATARAYSATDAEGLVLLLLASGSVGVGVLRGLIAMFSEVHHAEVIDTSPVAGEQLSLFAEIANDDDGERPVRTGETFETFIEGEATPINTDDHAASNLNSVSARCVVGVGVALVLILGLWPGVIAPLAQAVAAEYTFYR